MVGGEVGLGGAGRRLHEGQAVRAGQIVAAGDVDRAEQAAGVRVVDRRGGAGPRLHRHGEVLGREDLHRMVDRDRDAGGVGARVRLVPPGPGDEVHPLGPRPRPTMALDPEQPAGRVAHRKQVPPVVGDAAQQVAEQRQHPGQGVRLAILLQLGVGELQRREHVGVDGAGRPPP